MEKEKFVPKQQMLARITNWLLILAIFAVSSSLIINLFASAESASVAGTWTGIITDDYGSFIVYDFTVDIIQNDDQTISGSTFAQAQPEYRSVSAGTNFIGTIDDQDTISYQDVSIHDSNSGWCRIETTLDWTNDNGVDVLYGKWYGIGNDMCVGLDGRIHLTKTS